jgi:glycosyltransferase involved in cell wall biosynthesis
MPTVSIILPNYNHAKYLRQRIASVFAQTYQDFEIILLDDASTDESKTIIEEFRTNPKISVVNINTLNSNSPFRQWEKGISLAKGKYIWIAETDDYCEPEFLQSATKVLEGTACVDLFYCQSKQVNESNEIIGDYYYYTAEMPDYNWQSDFTAEGDKFIKDVLSRKNAIVNASAVVFRKNKITFSFGPFTKFSTCGDWLFWINYLRNSSLYYCSTPLNYFRTHGSSTRNLPTWGKLAIRELEEIAIKQFLVEQYRLNFLKDEIEHNIRMLIFRTPNEKLFGLNKLSLGIIGRKMVSPIHVLLSRFKKNIFSVFKIKKSDPKSVT